MTWNCPGLQRWEEVLSDPMGQCSRGPQGTPRQKQGAKELPQAGTALRPCPDLEPTPERLRSIPVEPVDERGPEPASLAELARGGRGGDGRAGHRETTSQVTTSPKLKSGMETTCSGPETGTRHPKHRRERPCAFRLTQNTHSRARTVSCVTLGKVMTFKIPLPPSPRDRGRITVFFSHTHAARLHWDHPERRPQQLLLRPARPGAPAGPGLGLRCLVSRHKGLTMSISLRTAHPHPAGPSSSWPAKTP